MENFDHILLFKTNFDACHKSLLKDIFDKEPEIYGWNIDLDDIDRVLRLKSATIKHQYVIQLITGKGFECCVLI